MPVFGESIKQTYLEQGELYNLLDLETDGDSDYGVGLNIPLDEPTEVSNSFIFVPIYVLLTHSGNRSPAQHLSHALSSPPRPGQ
jgi:hypothetical protein